MLCAKLGIDKQDVMAIGDSYNDLTMIRDCGIGVAMGNAVPAALAVASHVVADVDADGLVEALELSTRLP